MTGREAAADGKGKRTEKSEQQQEEGREKGRKIMEARENSKFNHKKKKKE